MTKPTSVVIDDDGDGRRPLIGGALAGVEAAVLALLLVVMVGQMVYLLSYTATLRRTQDALICQAEVTNQLRQAARVERDGQRALLTAVLSPPEGATPEQRRDASHAAISTYLNSLVKADADRASIGVCPPPEPS